MAERRSELRTIHIYPI